MESGPRKGDFYEYLGKNRTAYEFTSAGGTVSVSKGDRVRLQSDIGGGLAGKAGETYEYVGSGNPSADLAAQNYKGPGSDWKLIPNAIDLVSEDYGNAQLWKLVSLAPDELQVRAFIRDSGIDASGDVIVDARSSETIQALTAAASVAISGGSTAVGASGAGVYTENRINSDIRAFIDGGADSDTTDVLNADNVEVHASDSAQIEATAAAASVGGAFGSTGVAVSIGISVALNEITNQVDAFIANVDEATIENDVVIDAKSLPNDVGVVEDYSSDRLTPVVLEEGDLVRVAAGHDDGGQVDRVYRFRGYADFLSTDGGYEFTTGDGTVAVKTGDRVLLESDTGGGLEGETYKYVGTGDPSADLAAQNYAGPAWELIPEDETYELHLLTGSLIAEVDSEGEKTGRIFELVALGFDEDNPLIVGRLQGHPRRRQFDTRCPRFAEYSVDLRTEDFTDTKFWEIADASILARSAAASFSVAAGTTGIAVSGAGALALNVIGSNTKAYIEGSTLDSVGGDIDIDAENSSSIAAIVGAFSAAVGVGQTGVGVSIGAAIALNKIGFDLSGDPLSHQIHAYIDDSSINAVGALTLDAHASQQIDAVVLGRVGRGRRGTNGHRGERIRCIRSEPDRRGRRGLHQRRWRRRHHRSGQHLALRERRFRDQQRRRRGGRRGRLRPDRRCGFHRRRGRDQRDQHLGRRQHP